MDSHASTAPIPEWTISLTDDELSYALSILGQVDTIPGLESNTFLNETIVPQEYATRLLQRSLLAKGYAIFDPDANWTLEKTFANILTLIIKPAYMLEIVTASVGSPIASLVNGFITSDLIILQSFPYRYSHRFEVYFHGIDWAKFFLGLLPERSLSSQPQDYVIQKRSLPNHSMENSDHVASLIISAALEGKEQLLGMLSEQELILRLTLLSLTSPEIIGARLSLSGGANGYITIHDSDIFDQFGVIEIELADSQRISEMLVKWLEPIAFR